MRLSKDTGSCSIIKSNNQKLNMPLKYKTQFQLDNLFNKKLNNLHLKIIKHTHNKNLMKLKSLKIESQVQSTIKKNYQRKYSIQMEVTCY